MYYKPYGLLIRTALILVILSAISSPGSALLNGNGDASSWVTLRTALGANNGGKNKTALVLAADRTHRKDPTDGLNYYGGGWNISSMHYVASVLFTGFPLFLLAGIWLLGFGLLLLAVCIHACCCKSRRGDYSPFAYMLSLVLLVLFTVAAIVGSVVLYTGQEKFHSSTKNTLDFVVLQAHSTVDNLIIVSDYLTNAKKVTVDQMFLSKEVQHKIDQVNTMISSAADLLGNATNDNKDDISRILDNVRLVLVIAASVMLALAFLGFLSSISGMQYPVYILVVIGWVLVTITFIICGIFLVLHNVMGDTCVAMNEWVVNPTSHTAIDDIIPCIDRSTAQQALSESKEVTFETIQLINNVINTITNIDVHPYFKPLYYNQSGPPVPLLCNPYNPDLTDRICATGEVDLSNATQVWQQYVCQVANHECITAGRLTPHMYYQMIGAVTVSYGLHHYGPFLANLIDCSFVRATLTVIHNNHCPGLKRYSRWVYIGLALVSIAVMLSLIVWMFYARERRHRKYSQLQPSSSQASFDDGNDDGKKSQLHSNRASFDDADHNGKNRTSFDDGDDDGKKSQPTSGRVSLDNDDDDDVGKKP